MNKQELIAHFQEQKRIAEQEIAFWQAQPDDVPEKPKLRHGDFGICRGKGFYLNDSKRKLVKPMKNPVFEYENQGYDSYHPDYDNREVVFGNIFDLMKDWGEDFKNFMLKSSYDNRVFFVQTSLLRERAIYLGVEDRGKRVGVYLTESEAKEIWHALGHAIMGPKRKENK